MTGRRDRREREREREEEREIIYLARSVSTWVKFFRGVPKREDAAFPSRRRARLVGCLEGAFLL
jgi:hypothetical protein